MKQEEAKKPLLCRLGFHAWKIVVYGVKIKDVRQCARCGEVEGR